MKKSFEELAKQMEILKEAGQGRLKGGFASSRGIYFLCRLGV